MTPMTDSGGSGGRTDGGYRRPVTIQVTAGLIVAAVVALFTWLTDWWTEFPWAQNPDPGISQGIVPANAAGEPGDSSTDPSQTSSAAPTPRQVQLAVTSSPLVDPLEVGTEYVLEGTVSGAEGDPLKLELRADGATVATGVADASGRFSLAWKFRKAADDLPLEIRATDAAEYTGGELTVGTFDVLQWMPLSSFEAISWSKNVVTDAQAIMNTEVFDPSMIFTWSAASFGGWDDGDATFNIARKCATLRTTVGVDDSSQGSMAAWRFTVSENAAIAETDFVGIGAPVVLEADVSDVLRLTFSAQRLSPEGSEWEDYKADAVWGAPELLCRPS